MIENRAAELCKTASTSVSRMRHILPLRTDTGEILNQLGTLRETLVRLTEIASDEPRELLDTLRDVYPRLVPEIVSALETASRRNLMTVAAVRDSCASINDSLLELEYLKQRTTVQMGNPKAKY